MARALSLALALAVPLLGPASARDANDQAQAALDIRFGDFFKRPIGPRGLEPSDALRRADGHRVRLFGYMVREEQPQPGLFRLSPQPVQLSAHADGGADDLPPATVTVLLDAGQAGRVIAHRAGPLALSGRLELGRSEHIDGRVSWLRLRLDPDAVAEHASLDPASAAIAAP